MNDDNETNDNDAIDPESYRLETYNEWERSLSEKARLYRQVMGVEPDSLSDEEMPFYGAHSNCFKVGSIVFEVLENPDDGYRSSMDMMLIHPNQDMSGFFDTPLGTVRLERKIGISESFHDDAKPGSWNDRHGPTESDHYDGWCLIDTKDDHVWLEFGTKNYDDWYPMFWFYYRPKNQGKA